MNKNLITIKPDTPNGLCCPVCGQKVFGENAKPCEHTVFIFDGPSGEFTHSTPVVSDSIQDWVYDEDDFVDQLEEKGWGIIDHLQTLIPETAFIISIWREDDIDYICFDYE
jgi:hypothetical protein